MSRTTIHVIERRDGHEWQPVELLTGRDAESAERRQQRLDWLRFSFPAAHLRLAEYDRVAPREHIQD